jgi:endonuclease III
MRPHAANAFLLGVMFDRSVPWERAWDAADWMCQSIGDPENVASVWHALANMESRRLLGFLRYGYGGKAFHRHYKTFARLLPQAAEHMLKHYQGDPRRIWNDERDVNDVRSRLDSIPTIGPGLARMAVLILAREYGRLGGRKARQQLDPKPDVHLRRVFQRAGLTEPGSSMSALVESARCLAPDFPASLDAPAWDIGRNWCRPSRPNCRQCPLSKVCPRVGIRH